MRYLLGERLYKETLLARPLIRSTDILTLNIPMGYVESSTLSWRVKLHENTYDITIETSLDNGDTWRPHQPGDQIPGLVETSITTPTKLLVRTIVDTTNTINPADITDITLDINYQSIGHYAICSDGRAYFNGQEISGEPDFIDLSNGTLRIQGGRKIDELYVTPRLLTKDEIDILHQTQYELQDPKESIDTSFRKISHLSGEIDADGHTIYANIHGENKIVSHYGIDPATGDRGLFVYDIDEQGNPVEVSFTGRRADGTVVGFGGGDADSLGDIPAEEFIRAKDYLNIAKPPIAIKKSDVYFPFESSLYSTQGIKPLPGSVATLLPEGGVEIEWETTNLLTTRTAPAQEVVAVSKGQKYTLSAYGSGTAQVYQQRVDDTPLVLAKTGQDVTYTESTWPDFQRGTLDGVVVTGAGVELAADLSDDFDRSTLGPDWEIAPGSQGSVQLQNGELVLTGDSSRRMWVRTTRTFEARSIVFRARRDSADEGSDIGLAFNWDGNPQTSGAGEPLNGYRLFWRVWENPSTLTIRRYDNGVSTVLASTEFPPDNNEHEFAILIENGVIIRVFVDGVQRLRVIDSTYTSGYIGFTAREGGNRRGRYNWIVVNREPIGTRVSPIFVLSPVGTAADSSIAWDAITPTGTSVKVETSLNGGATWQVATNGGPIPGLNPGDSLDGKSLRVRQTLTTENMMVTPVLTSLTVSAVTAYAANFSRMSPMIDLSPFGLVSGTSISWTADTPPGTSVTAETRLSPDGGQTWQGWQQVTNGGPIPGISAGTDLSNTRLQTRVTLQTTDLTVTPRMDSLTVEIGHQAVAGESLRQSSPLTFTAIENRVRLVPSAGIIKWQLEQKPRATSFVDGTRPAGKLTYQLPTNLNTDFTIHLRGITKHNNFTPPGFLFDDDNHNIYLWKNEGSYILSAIDNSGTIRNITHTPDNMVGKFNFVITRTGNKIAFYVNGTLQGEIEHEWNPFASKIWIGTRSGGTNCGDGTLYQNLLVCPYAVSPETIAAWHSSNTSFHDFSENPLVSNSMIVEQGSNGNGWYIRWENGLQVCWGSVDIGPIDIAHGNAYISAPARWGYPSLFSAHPSVSGIVMRKEGSGLAAHISGDGVMYTAGFYFYGTRSSSSSSDFIAYLLAIGRWK